MAAFPDLRFEIVRVAHGEGFSAGEWRAMTTGSSGWPRRAAGPSGGWTATLDDDGLITHLVSYYDGAPCATSGSSRATARESNGRSWRVASTIRLRF